MTTGRVFLVGAGPGDPELITLKAVRALRAADVILIDELVDDAVLAHARPGVRVVRVGKRGGGPSTPQAFIERLMIAEARRGHTVVRLKGGDPFVFGRGAEECAALRAAGVPFEVVHGITAGLAAPASIGIPLTHRAAGHGAILVTGHAGEGSGSEPDWRAYAATGLPLVIYMGVARAAHIRRALLGAGMAATTPVAVVSDATRAGQASVVSTLGAFVGDMCAARLGSPAIIVVGETVRCALPAVALHMRHTSLAGL
ncbi:MAG: uroporphyrinogen-III C-methyltransferase [Betaproteobacteria bacterium]|nr:uroporphyrinogen-III C-methyltransferase [Betaproteobacteria bacterium]